MKKWLAISLAILAAVGMAIPTVAAPAAVDDPPAKMHVTVISSANYYNNGIIFGGSIRCTTIEGGNYIVYGNHPSNAQTTVTFDTWDFTCLGETSVGGYHQSGRYHQETRAIVEVTYTANPGHASTIYYDADAQTNGTWYPQANCLNPPGQIGKGEAVGSLCHGGEATMEGNTTVTAYIFAHDSIKPPCSEDWETTSTVGSGTIAATNEAGVAQTLVVGSEYRLTVSGGPWNDGTTDRHDTAVKIGSAAWQALKDWAISPSAACSEGDPLDPTKTIVVFTATDADWKIRVNDVTGQFANNTGGMDYLLEGVAPASAGGCGEFLLGAQLESVTIDAKWSEGYMITSSSGGLSPGSWIAVTTSGGPWKDGGAGSDRYDVAWKNADNTWSELTGASNTSCHTHNGNYVTAYLQIVQSGNNAIRVNDTGGVWTNNTGSMHFTVNAVTYSPYPPNGCSQTYQLGALIKTQSVSGSSEQGFSIDGNRDPEEVSGGEVELPKRLYAIETSGVWYSNNTPTPSTLGGIVRDPPAGEAPNLWAWTDLLNFPDLLCSAPLDPAGHVIIYFQSFKDATYWLRAQDPAGTYSDNFGSLTFSIYEATNLRVPPYTPGDMPGPGICDPYYSHEETGETRTLLGNNSAGNVLLTANKIYGIETSAGPWKNNGTNSYEVAISENNGLSWALLSNYSSAICAQSADGNHILVYFQALPGRQYKLRVYDPTDTYANNTLSINYIVYDTIATIHNPWDNCAKHYSLSQIQLTTDQSTIPAQFGQSGIPVPYIESGKTYAIEISDTSYWYADLAPSTHHFDAQVSADNGDNWDVIEPGLAMASCIVQTRFATDPAEMTYRIYFTAAGTYKLRANVDTVSPVWTGLYGTLKYYLYGTVSSDPPVDPCTGSDCNPVPPPWTTACFETYQRPASLFKWVPFQFPTIEFGTLGSIPFPSFSVPIPAVGDWIAYLAWTVRNYFAWCPMHTAALAAIQTSYNNYEPFGTISEITAAADHIQSTLDTLTTSGGEGAGQDFRPHSVIFNTGGGETEAGTGWEGALPVLTADSPWMGGQGQWNNGVPLDAYGIPLNASGADAVSTSRQAYVDYCATIFNAHLGPAASEGLCGMVSITRLAPVVWIFMQILTDGGALLGLMVYLKKKWIEMGGVGQ
jgi:hypothetical protein